jgi:hypothetical protein
MNPLTVGVTRRPTIRALCFVCAFLLASLGAARAQLIYADSFNYPDGEIAGASGSPWVVNYPFPDALTVTAGRLFLTGTNKESIRFDFPSSYGSGLLYARMVVNFSELPVGNGNYFAFFRAAFTDNLRCRIWANTNAAAPGKFQLGLTAIGDPPLMIPKDLYLGTNYAIVCRYVLSNSFCSLWINPTDENDTSARVDSVVDEGQWSIGHFGFLQTAYYDNSGYLIGNLTVDDLRVGRTFSEVLPGVKFTSISNAPAAVRLWAVGQANTDYLFQATTNLASTNWVNLSTNTTDAFGDVLLPDPDATNFPSRFYRLLRQ